MFAPWHRQFEESTEAYERFEQFLAMGPERSIYKLSKVVAITAQGLGKMARRYNWRVRAAAWDAQSNGQRYEPSPIAPKQPKPEKKPLEGNALKPPPPRLPVIEAKVVEANLDKLFAGDDAEHQKDELLAYQAAFLPIGKELLVEAVRSQNMAVMARMSYEAIWEKVQAYIREDDLEKAQAWGFQLNAYNAQYWKALDVRLKMIAAARLHWGDAAGIHPILEMVYGGKA